MPDVEISKIVPKEMDNCPGASVFSPINVTKLALVIGSLLREDQNADSLCAGENAPDFSMVLTPFYEAFSLVYFST